MQNLTNPSIGRDAACPASLLLHRPTGLAESMEYAVEACVGDYRAQVYCAHATVGNRFRDYSMAYEKMTFCSLDWDFTSPLTLTVKPNRPWRQVDIRPKHAKLPYTCGADGTIVVTLTAPTKFSLELDGDRYHNLFVFAGLPMEMPVGDNVRVFGPGVHEAGDIVLRDNETLWLDGDAVVYGTVFCQGKNIRLLGRGILTGAHESHDLDKHRKQLFRAEHCTDLTVTGVIMLDSTAWTFCTVGCRDVLVQDIKHICWMPNSDGFDVCGCQNMTMADCFLRNFDDNISLKSFGGDNLHIRMERCVLWADCAHSMLIGPESKKDEQCRFADIVFDEIDVLEHKEYSDRFMGVMAIFCADEAIFEDILWQNIRVERMTYGRLFDLRYVTEYATTVGKSVRNVQMKHIVCDAPQLYRSRVIGLDEDHRMEGILLEDCTLSGIPAGAGDPLFEIGDFVEFMVQ